MKNVTYIKVAKYQSRERFTKIKPKVSPTDAGILQLKSTGHISEVDLAVPLPVLGEAFG